MGGLRCQVSPMDRFTIHFCVLPPFRIYCALEESWVPKPLLDTHSTLALKLRDDLIASDIVFGFAPTTKFLTDDTRGTAMLVSLLS